MDQLNLYYDFIRNRKEGYIKKNKKSLKFTYKMKHGDRQQTSFSRLNSPTSAILLGNTPRGGTTLSRALCINEHSKD